MHCLIVCCYCCFVCVWEGGGGGGGGGGGEVARHIPNKTLDIKLWPFRLTSDA